MRLFFWTDIEEKKKERACYVLFFVLTAVVHLIFCSPGMSVITNIVLIFLITVCYEGALKKKIFVTLLVYGTNMGCDLVAVHLLTDYSITGKVGECAAYITVLLLLICDVISEKILIKNKGEDKTPHGMILAVISALCLAELLIVEQELKNRILLVLFGCCVLAVVLLIFYLYDVLISAYKKLEEQQKQLQQQLDLGALKQKDYCNACAPIEKKCRQLLLRISKMKFFDPACGSGNFLIITYKSLRLLEMDILKVIRSCKPGQQELNFIDGSCITLKQFYGIELLDFPHEVAMLSLWLAEHQMNRKFSDEFKVNTRALPLHNITQIVCGNACRIEWNEVCPHTPEEEVFVFGNPPYVGSRLQNKLQKEDMYIVFKEYTKEYKKLDYISCWFIKGKQYIDNTKSKYAFVSTNSIVQGEQVSLLWSVLFSLKANISFAYTSFKWNNNAKNSAGVTCVIIGITNENNSSKKLFINDKQYVCDNINPYLYVGSNCIVEPLYKNISQLPIMLKGCAPGDDGNLLLTKEEKHMLLEKYPILIDVIKPYLGADEIINGYRRYCLWFYQKDYFKYKHINEIQYRVDKCKEFRLKSTKEATVKKALTPYLFDEIRYKEGLALVIPQTSSEKREYIPIYIGNDDTVYSNGARIIYDASIWLFGIISSKIHNTWVRIVSGRLETRIQYSNTLCYNTFPFPTINEEKKKQIEESAENVLVTRAFYPEKTLAELYDPDKMPEDLKEAHAVLDDIVESCYPGYPFANDEARLECLFKLYEKMTNKK